MYEVQKRDGKIAEFDIAKISSAIAKAFDALGKQYHPSTIDLLALNVTAHFEPKIRDGIVSVEDVQDSVEEVLSTAGYADVAKSYILYRKQREKVRNANATLLDYKDLVDQYVKVEDWRVKENSTVTYSVGGLILSNSGAITANYWLSEIYDDEVAKAHRDADIHLHDLSMLTGYCAGWSLKQLIQEGLGGVPGKITSKPASHLSSLCNQMVNFLGIMQNEWAGAQAFSSFDTYLAPFVKADGLSYEETKQCVESFVFGVNTPSRWGTQAPFSNITLDWVCPADLRDQPAIVGGREQGFTYGDCQAEMDMVNKAFIEIMIEGDANGRGFQYPIPTYSITRDFDWSETENNRLLFEMTSKYGTPYFSNYINSDMEPSDVRSMCCRLRLDLRELRKKSGGFFGSGESTGSIGVVTINMPRIAYQAVDEADFYRRLDHLMDVSARSLHTKREVITKLLDAGLYPYTKRYLGTFENHFSTIGLVGMNEACLNASWLRADMTQEAAQAFTKDVLNHMRARLADYQEEYGDLYNLEATPAESTTYRFAKHDKEQFPDIISANDQGKPYYTNSSHLPVGFTDDIFSALDVQDELQTLYTSGTVFHAFLGEKLPDWKAAATLVRKIAENYKLPYYTMSPTYSVCKNHGYIAGEVYECPCCHEETEVYSRINRLLSPGEELERRQVSGVRRPRGVRPGAFASDARRRRGRDGGSRDRRPGRLARDGFGHRRAGDRARAQCAACWFVPGSNAHVPELQVRGGRDGCRRHRLRGAVGRGERGAGAALSHHAGADAARGGCGRYRGGDGRRGGGVPEGQRDARPSGGVRRRASKQVEGRVDAIRPFLMEGEVRYTVCSEFGTR